MSLSHAATSPSHSLLRHELSRNFFIRRRCVVGLPATSSNRGYSAIPRQEVHNKDATRAHAVNVVVAMSGGVDSSVAAYLLKNQMRQKKHSSNKNLSDVNLIGLHMSNWSALDEDSDSNDNPRSSRKENIRAKSTNQLHQPLYKMVVKKPKNSSSSSTFFFEPFVESLSSESCDVQSKLNIGEFTTPNPDFGCNTYIKFGAMKDYATTRLDADYIATGHYARLWHRAGFDSSIPLDKRQHYFYEWMMERSLSLEHEVKHSLLGRPEEEWILDNQRNKSSPFLPLLLAGVDRGKDQSYFLSGVKAEAFRNVIFPLGHLMKHFGKGVKNSTDDARIQQSVRDIAQEANIPTASKRDSMGICFIGKRNFGKFVSQYVTKPPVPGNFVDVDTGKILGRHEGTVYYTLGQGAKISGANTRYFVCGKGGGDETTVFVCNNTHHPALYSDELLVDFELFNWIGLGRKEDLEINGKSCGHIPRPLIDGESVQLWARTRHLQPLVSCRVYWDRAVGCLNVRFDSPMRATTPGQILALYAGSDGLVCLGGGPIRERGASYMERDFDLPLNKIHPSGNNDLSLKKHQWNDSY
ncbi:hypothetical protein ACHAXS_006595 [Conticribra weissflogii]